MTTINDLAIANSLSPDDKLPMWSNTNGVTRALPISVLTAAFLTQDDIALIAASSSVETFISDALPNPDGLPTFTAGTTLALTLQHDYVSADNVETHFDAAFQGPDQFSIAGMNITFKSPIPVGTERVYVSGGAVREIGAPSDGTVGTLTLIDGAVTTPKLADDAVTADKLASSSVVDASVVVGTALYNRITDLKNVRDFGAKGDGVTDDSAAFQAAINSGICRIPYSANGYRIATALNATNRDTLVIEGVGYAGPQWGLAYSLPVAGSTILADTGFFGLDITGSNNVILKNFNIISKSSMAHPAVIGIVGGTSNDNSRLGSPGGSGYVFENICVALPNSGSSIPIYINNGNVGKYINVNTMGQYGFCLTMNNPLGIVPPYAGFGTLSASDGNYIAGMVNAGYGQYPVFYIENANDLQVDQSYVVYLAGAGTFPYPGPGYGVYINNCTDVRMKVESDNFPSLFRMDGNCLSVSIDGIISADPIPTPPTLPCVGFFNGGQVKDCKFHVLPVGSFNTNSNYHYSTVGGGAPTLASIINCDFYFDTGNTPNVAFFNTSNVNPVPYFNNTFRGNIDLPVGTAPMTFQVNGVAVTGAQHRTWMNGIRQGTA